MVMAPSHQWTQAAQMLQQLQVAALSFAFPTAGELGNRDPDFGILMHAAGSQVFGNAVETGYKKWRQRTLWLVQLETKRHGLVAE